MAKDFRKQLAKQIGEHLVVAELGRRNIIAAPFAGNVPDIDVLAYANGQAVALQVKSARSVTISVDATTFLDMRFEGEIQKIDGLRSIDRTLIYVLVAIGETTGQDKFFIFEQGDLQDVILANHTNVLLKHQGRRPKKWQSTHCSYTARDLAFSENNWALIERRLGLSPIGNTTTP